MRRSFSRSNLSRVGGVVNNTLDSLGLRHKVQEQQVVTGWAGIVGPHIASASRADQVREGILFVACKSSAWTSELSLHKPEILRRIAQTVGKNVVTDIRFSSRGYRRKENPVSEDADAHEMKNLEAVSLTEDEIETAQKIAGECSVPELAECIQKAVMTSKRLQKVKDEPGKRG